MCCAVLSCLYLYMVPSVTLKIALRLHFRLRCKWSLTMPPTRRSYVEYVPQFASTFSVNMNAYPALSLHDLYVRPAVYRQHSDWDLAHPESQGRGANHRPKRLRSGLLRLLSMSICTNIYLWQIFLCCVFWYIYYVGFVWRKRADAKSRDALS
jgi:hypothetical protein